MTKTNNPVLGLILNYNDI